ncbi:MAG: TetR/AcrR family transcriptional regulator [Mariniphaga sp.]|nr:TetR/AcrR family transcriptional regulator [Mariniphaga sp.]
MDELQNSTKYQDIIKTAHDLFWKFGIKRVTIEEVCKEAVVSKMTFYRFFPNKTELAKTVIKNMFDENIVKYRELMSSDIPFSEKVKQQILMKFEGTRDVSSELIKDVYGRQIPELTEFWEEKANEVLQEVLASYKDAQQKGWIRKDVNVEFISFYTTKLFEIVSDEKAVALYGSVQPLVMELINMFFYGILPHDSEE